MQVRENNRDFPVDVYGVYWSEGKRFYRVIPYAGYRGLMSLAEDECVLVNPCFSTDFMLCKDVDGNDMIIHWAIVDIIDELYDLDERAMDELLKRLNL